MRQMKNRKKRRRKKGRPTLALHTSLCCPSTLQVQACGHGCSTHVWPCAWCVLAGARCSCVLGVSVYMANGWVGGMCCAWEDRLMGVSVCELVHVCADGWECGWAWE